MDATDAGHIDMTGAKLTPRLTIELKQSVVSDSPKENRRVYPIAVACQNLGYSPVRSDAQIVDDITFTAEPGALLAVLGPSGAGKTTLLNLIANRVKRGSRSGHVYFNNKATNSGLVRKHCSYVMTDGRLLPYLTVRETLLIAAKLKLPDTTAAQRAERVDVVISELGLNQCRDTYIGGEWKKGISTGEKKRVCIAIELLGNPSVLILDECTSGLDSSLACELLSVLNRLARSGRTVITSIHQPTTQMWSTLDRILLLSKGRMLYLGPSGNAKDYFARHGLACPKNFNPADFYLTLASNYAVARIALENGNFEVLDGFDIEAESSSTDGISPKLVQQCSKLDQCFSESKELAAEKSRVTALIAGETPIPSSRSDVGNASCISSALHTCRKSPRRWLGQVGALYLRSLKNSIRNPIVCCVVLLVQALQGIILGGIFFQISSNVVDKPLYYDTEALVSNPWVKLFIDGIDGRQPLLEALEYGVDGLGSQPLYDAVFNHEWISWFVDGVKCASRFFADAELTPVGYPSLGVDFRFPGGNPSLPDNDQATLFSIDPQDVLEGTMRSTQMLDHQILRYNWTHVAIVQSSVEFWNEVMTMSPLGRQYMMRLVTCWQYRTALAPPIRDTVSPSRKLGKRQSTLASNPGFVDLNAKKARNSQQEDSVSGTVASSHRTGIQNDSTNHQTSFTNPEPVIDDSSSQLLKLLNTAGDSNSGTKTETDLSEPQVAAAPRRELISIEDLRINELFASLLGQGGQDFLDALSEIVDRATACTHEGCKWLGSLRKALEEDGEHLYETFMAIVNILGALFFATANLGFASYDALLTFPQERILFNRESAGGLYGASSYFVAKNLADLPFQIVPSFVLATIFYLMLGIGNTAGQYFTYVVITVGITFAAYGFGYLVSAASSRMEFAILIAPFVLVIWLTIAGFFLREFEIPGWIFWFSHFSFYRWGFYSLVVNQFPAGFTFGAVPNEIPLLISGFTNTILWQTILYIYLLGFGFRFLAYLALRFLNRTVGLQ